MTSAKTMTTLMPEMAEPVQIISNKNNLDPLISKVKFEVKTTSGYKQEIVWRNVLLFLYLHYCAFCGLFYLFTLQFSPKSFIWGLFFVVMSIQGIGSGAHRLWSHRTYKAKLPLRIMLMIFQTIALQNDILEWCRDHRGHHKFTDTDADPHNSQRGFFFCHMGWLLMKKHPEVIAKGKTLDLSDLKADPVVMFQKKYYLILAPLFSFIIPAVVPWYFWNESWSVCWCGVAMMRYTFTLHGTWLVNSAAHKFGYKPYDRNIAPVENISVSVITMGEGWHNYHHVFPWDYKAAELGTYASNFTAKFIEFMARIGWAYDLKSVSDEVIARRVQRTGDGSWQGKKGGNVDGGLDSEEMVWGWGDVDLKEEVRRLAKIQH